MIDPLLLDRAKQAAKVQYSEHAMSINTLDGICTTIEDVLAELGCKAHADWSVSRTDIGTFRVTISVHEAPQEIELELRR